MRARLSARARRDNEDILLYTIQEWGVERAKEYAHDLEEALARLERFPILGKPAPRIDDLVRVLKVKQHLMIYEILEDEIVIIRIVHVRTGQPLDLGC